MKKLITLYITIIIATQIHLFSNDYENYRFNSDIKINRNIKLPVPDYVIESRSSSQIVDHFKYLPVFDKGTYEYEYESTSFTGKRKIVMEFLGYSEKDSSTLVSLTYYNKKDTKTFNYTIKITQRGIIFNDIITGEERTEIPIPLFKDKRWSENGNENRVIGFSSKVETPYGKYDNCLKILTSLKENGKMERFYAEGIGLVMEKIKTEDKTDILTLVRYIKK